MLYTTLKYLHIILAIAAFGFNLSYPIWIARGTREGKLGFTLRGIKFIDDRMANPAYFLLAFTGIGMVLVSGMPWYFWITTALGLLILALIIAYAGYTPTLRKQIELVEAGRQESEEYRALNTRSNALGLTLLVLVLVIIGLMVFKPIL